MIAAHCQHGFPPHRMNRKGALGDGKGSKAAEESKRKAAKEKEKHSSHLLGTFVARGDNSKNANIFPIITRPTYRPTRRTTNRTDNSVLISTNPDQQQRRVITDLINVWASVH
ncbi:hypothetical protein niasHT_021703 [Heterodera trifolii]|uniref:Uncharacterized protein n=1 Tax=Heterodera trifolii TaxID=157864 RepID=A0ABD2KRM8_9BILA